MPPRLFPTLLLLLGHLHAHNIPSITLETRFQPAGNFDLLIDFDPRVFLAFDPRSLPPIEGAWFSDQSPDQAAATLRKADEYLKKSLTLVFNGRQTSLPKLTIQPIDGTDNTLLKPDTQELHLLAKCSAPIPKEATEFQVAFAKSAAVDLILLNTFENASERRPQVLFPGETSRPFLFRHNTTPPLVASKTSPTSSHPSVALLITLIAIFIGWRLLKKHRHFHRGHRKPKEQDR